jgi:hypothetical protein
MSSNPVIAGFGMATCSMTALFALVLVVFVLRLSRGSRPDIVRVVLLGSVVLFELVRVTWWALELVYEPQVPQVASAVNASYVLGRLGWTVQLLTVLFLVYTWANAVHQQVGLTSAPLLFLFRLCFIIVMCLVILSFVALITLPFALCLNATQGLYANTCTPIYNGHIIAIAVTLALGSASQMLYGIWLLRLVRKNKSNPTLVRAVGAVIVSSAAMTLFSLLRTIFLVYRPITGQFLPLGVFYSFVYIVPDAVTGAGVCVIILYSIVGAAKQLPSSEEMQSPLIDSRPAAYEI